MSITTPTASERDLPRLAAVALPEDLQPETGACRGDSTVAVASASTAFFSGVSVLSNAAAARVDVASTPCWLTSRSGFIAASSDAPRARQSIWWVADLMRWMSLAKHWSVGKRNSSADNNGNESSTTRKAVFELHENLERCIASVDCSGEKVFQALVNTRVSLLNILSPTF
ncbi:LOW QUALITY PROTEIN: hypothetical protein BRADI_2g02755v3 [Brachypodium distachyon]|uniref:Uncharacterized protein n=1 Tax=Brachypodium distachyon TaxID=15368 RepID=A0A0Q3QME2_BRADI|nr:LOW QUALITY PROTEIN: hypothetical protein BRADI_2g02755v3 [Brachypodium distachyon]